MMPRGWLDEDGPQPEFAKLYGLQVHGSAELKVTPTLVYLVKSKANLQSDRRSKKPGQRGVKAPMNTAATWNGRHSVGAAPVESDGQCCQRDGSPARLTVEDTVANRAGAVLMHREPFRCHRWMRCRYTSTGAAGTSSRGWGSRTSTPGSPSNADAPLDKESRPEMQRRVDRYYRMFVESAARNRGTTVERVESEFGQGRIVGAQDVMRRGTADRVGTFDNVVRNISGRANSPGRLTARRRRLALHGQ